MKYEEALRKTTEHVEKLSTNARDYQDGVRFADKVDAVERFARFLIEETEPDVAPETTALFE
ncbi:hypothetical protein [Streptomyces scopuliridis]|uniref:hypothetical protein n=1 Tax=Streptomyces scopuliridis TaxID=452529 RepID=UPI0036C263DA